MAPKINAIKITKAQILQETPQPSAFYHSFKYYNYPKCIKNILTILKYLQIFPLLCKTRKILNTEKDNKLWLTQRKTPTTKIHLKTRKQKENQGKAENTQQITQ